MPAQPTWSADNGDKTYSNPILYTDYSDPDVLRVGGDYYLVASSFCNTPGLPVLHSKDLVNWELISYVLEQIPEPGYEKPRHGCGVWAPAIRHHNGLFYVYYPMPDEGIFVCTAEDPAGPWSAPVCVKRAAGWIDPCPFWDDDGRAYLVNAFAKSRIGFKSILHISEMSPDGLSLLDEGRHVFDGHDTQPTIEGPKLYKRNGWYYIFAPAGSVQSGWQTVLRSRSIYGPYAEKIVMIQSGTAVNGPHQGGWVDTPEGSHWFVHFQDVGNAGRIVHLQPMVWENDWPVIGRNEGEGFGTPVQRWQKPAEIAGWHATVSASDDFTGGRIGLQWQWNANYRDDWYAVDNGLTLFARPRGSAALCDQPNLLLQKWSTPAFTATAHVSVEELAEGEEAGFISLGRLYYSIGIRKEAGAFSLLYTAGEIGGAEQTRVLRTNIDVAALRLGFAVDVAGKGQLFAAGASWQERLSLPALTPGFWVGIKFGLYALSGAEKGSGYLKVQRVEVEAAPRQDRS